MRRAAILLPAVLLAPLWISSCAGGPDRTLSPRAGGAALSPGEREKLLEGGKFLREGNPAAALALAEELLRGRPWDVEAHRLRQNAMREWFRSGPALEEYSRLLREHPERPEAWYLLGRISFPPARQAALFRKALTLDPRFARAWGGLGWAFLAMGRAEDAVEALSRALALDPDEADFHLALGRALRVAPGGGLGKAAAHFRIAARLRPGDPSPWYEIAMSRGGSEGILALGKALALEPGTPFLFERFSLVLRRDPGRAPSFFRAFLETRAEGLCPEGLLRLARLRAEAGEGVRAVRAFRKAGAGLGRLDAEDRIRLASLLFGMGRWKEGLAQLVRWRPAGVPLRGRPGEARAALEEALSSGKVPPGRLAGLLARAGWVLPAEAWAGWVRSKGGELPRQARRDLARGREVLLLEELLQLALARAGNDKRPGLEGLLAELRKSTRAFLGKDLVGRPRVVSVLGLGVYLDPTGPGLPSFFLRRGRLLLLGRRAGLPPQGFTGRIVTQGKELLSLEGRTREVTFWLLEGEGLKPAGVPVDLAGLALDRFYLVDLEAVRRWAFQVRTSARRAREARALEQPLGPGLGPEGTFAPSDLAAKCRILGLERKGPRLEERLFEIVRLHELGHLADAAWFLPPLRHLGRVAGLLLRCNLDPKRVQAELERRAQAAALARTRWPYLALAQASGALPVGADLKGEVHEVGYALLVRDLAREALPLLGRAGRENPAASLFRLRPEELHFAAGKVSEKMGLPSFRVSSSE